MSPHSSQRRGIAVPPVPGIGSATNRELEKVHDSLLPPLQAQGPHHALWRRGLVDDYDLELFEMIYLRLLDVESEADGEFAMRDCALARPTTWETWIKTLQGLKSAATPADLELLPIGTAAFHRLLDWLGHCSA